MAERIIDIAAPKIMVTIMIAKANAGQVHAHQGACDTFDIPALFPLGYMCRRVRDFYWRIFGRHGTKGWDALPSHRGNYFQLIFGN